MEAGSPNTSVIDLIGYFEQKQTSPSRPSSIAQPQAVRPGSAGRLLAMDAAMNHMSTSHMPTIESSSVPSQAPQTHQVHSRHEFPSASHAMHRRGAPQNLKLSTADTFAPFTDSPYATVPALSSPLVAIPNLQTSTPLSASAPFAGFSSPTLTPAACPRRSHTRHQSQASISSIHSSSSFLFPTSTMDFDNIQSGRSPIMTPPTSPKKRKSPTKSPNKAQNRPNYLDRAIKIETGVTNEDINAKIGEPLPEDPKNWRCLWDDCKHVAARKENIRAHVQTHLDDRPYQCPECSSTFVRPHDFTRHYTTHVDSRDFKCPDCTQAFNRADALQRHRDRDFCNGIVPPGSPTKVRRTLDVLDKKKDTAGRRQKKQAMRKLIAAQSSDPADLMDDFLSSPGESPEYLSSDAGSPDMMMMNDFDLSHSSQTTLKASDMSNFLQQHEKQHNTQPQHIAQVYNAMMTMDTTSFDPIQQILEFNSSGNTVTKSSPAIPTGAFSFSPPGSPAETHSQLTLKQFSPSQHEATRHSQNPTPPASRDSMLDFLNADASHYHTNGSIASAPSLPDLSDTSPSPSAFEMTSDIDDIVQSFATGSASETPDWLMFENSDFVKNSSLLAPDMLESSQFFNWD